MGIVRMLTYQQVREIERDRNAGRAQGTQLRQQRTAYRAASRERYSGVTVPSPRFFSKKFWL